MEMKNYVKIKKVISQPKSDIWMKADAEKYFLS